MPDQNPYAPPTDTHPYMPPVNPNQYGNVAPLVLKKKRHTLRTIFIVIGSFAAVLLVGGLIAAAAGGAAKVPATPGGSFSPATQQVDVPSAPAPTPAAVMPTAGDFGITMKTTSKDCFGSAGCLVTVQPAIAYHGSPDITTLSCEITYSVTGGKDGDSVATLHATGTAFPQIDTMIQTPSSKTKVSATITDVSCN